MSHKIPERRRRIVRIEPLALVVLWLSCACTKVDRSEPRPASVDAGSAVLGSVDAALEASPPPPPTASALPKPSGSATLIVQRVDSHCMAEPGETQTAVLGHDVLIETTSEDHKVSKAYAFCPATAPDGGKQKPAVDMWEMCRSFPKCRVVSDDSGATDKVVVECGKERVTLESDGTRTILRGSFGEREVLPFPTRIAPAKTTKRIALIDC
jgi:hypothetical protein